MNFISLIAVILGIISVVITLKYVKFYSQIRRNLNKLSSTCADKNYPSVIFEIQNSLDLKDKEFRNFLIKNKKKIIDLGEKSEGDESGNETTGDQSENTGDQSENTGDQSENTGDQSENTGDESFTVDDNTSDEIFTDKEGFVNYLSVSQRGLTGTMGHFVKDFKKNDLNKQAKTLKFNKLDKLSNQKRYSMYANSQFSDKEKKTFKERNWCLVNHDNKNYCFEVSNKKLCKNKLVNDRKKCDF